MRFDEINVTMDVFASVVIIILICYILSHPKPRRPSDNMCMLICICNLAMLLGDIPNWLCEGFARPWYPAALHVGIFIQYLGGILVMPAYTFYLKVHLAPKVQVNRKIIGAVLAIGGAGVVLLVVNLLNGMFYYIDGNNVYHRGDWWILTQIMSVAIMLIDLSMELYYRRYMRRKDIIIFQGYKVLPLAAVLIQSRFYGIAATYPAVTISILLIFLNIQSEQAFLLEQQETRLTQSRIAIMMSQIQPHFLFNALTGIKQLCDTEPRKASDALEHFSYFLRGNLDSLSDRNLITFDKELEHVRDYFYLEKIRFGDRLNLHLEIGTTDFLLPSLTLQPIVENAVRHGITKKRRGGTVAIISERLEDKVVITVSDDGIGFDVGASEEDGRTHVGISNVRKRLQIQCDGTLDIKSEKGVGTTVTIVLPQNEG